jgi:hypothetical protein
MAEWRMRSGSVERRRRQVKLVEEVLSREEEMGEGREWVWHEVAGLWCLL